MTESIPLCDTTLYDKALGCLLGGLIGDAMGTPTEGRDYPYIEQHYGWVDDFEGSGTDDTVMKDFLAQALIATDGYATLDDWAATWLAHWDEVGDLKRMKFFISVVHTIQKLGMGRVVPRMAALGNMPSSSSAMCISPVGIVNACNPRQAAQQAYNLAALIHVHEVGFCQDGAACMAAAVAAAFDPAATVESVLETATQAILPLSGREMRERIAQIRAMAQQHGEYRAFRAAVYALGDAFFCRIMCDSRETIPLALGLFQLAQGDLERCVTYCANFGRDADTIASMAGAIAGALHGAQAIKAEWVHKAEAQASTDQEQMALELARVVLSKGEQERRAQERLASLA